MTSETQPKRVSEKRYMLRLFFSNPLVVAGSAIAAVSVVLAATSPLLVDPNAWKAIDFGVRNCWNSPWIDWHISNIFTCPTGAFHPLGTDAYGRDLWQMILLSLPTDLEVAFEIVGAALLIGVTLGSVAAYAGGLVDEGVLRVTDIFLAFPSLVLAIIIATVVARQLWALEVAVLAVWWPTYVRLSRSQVLAEKERPYVEALRAMGAGRVRIIFRHLLPNSIYPVLVQATLDIGAVILTFAGLMFLGFSPSPLIPELGNIINDGFTKASPFTSPWIVLFPGLVILLIGISFNLIGDGIRDVLDPRLRR